MDIFNNLIKRDFELPDFSEFSNNLKEAYDNFNKAISDFNFEEFKNQMEDWKNDLSSRFANLVTQPNKVVFKVDYDRDNDVISTNTNGTEFTVHVESLDGHSSSMSTFSLPQGEGWPATPARKYDGEEKVMLFTFERETSEEPEATDNQAEDLPTDQKTQQEPVEDEAKAKAIQAALKLHQEGWSFRRIGKEVGVSDKTVARWVRKYS